MPRLPINVVFESLYGLTGVPSSTTRMPINTTRIGAISFAASSGQQLTPFSQNTTSFVDSLLDSKVNTLIFTCMTFFVIFVVGIGLAIGYFLYIGYNFAPKKQSQPNSLQFIQTIDPSAFKLPSKEASISNDISDSEICRSPTLIF